MISILVVEDEHDLNQMVCDFLRNAGYATTSAYNGREALDLLKNESWDILLLDVMLPEIDGFSILQQFPRDESPLPGVIMLTARNLEMDKLRGFARGADDYLTKPFSLFELHARIKSLLRRLPVGGDSILRRDNLEIDFEKRQLFFHQQPIPLTTFQFDLITPMIKYPEKVFTREMLQASTGEMGRDSFDRTIDAHIKNIRKRFGEDRNWIETVRGVGYRFNPPKEVENEK